MPASRTLCIHCIGSSVASTWNVYCWAPASAIPSIHCVIKTRHEKENKDQIMKRGKQKSPSTKGVLLSRAACMISPKRYGYPVGLGSVFIMPWINTTEPHLNATLRNLSQIYCPIGWLHAHLSIKLILLLLTKWVQECNEYSEKISRSLQFLSYEYWRRWTNIIFLYNN